MSEVAFHFNVPEKLAHACRIARKALRYDLRVAVVGAEPDLRRLDRMLWAMRPTDFVAHCMDDADAFMQRASPVLLARDARSGQGRDLLLQLGAQIPEGFDAYPRVVEIVSQHGEDERALARVRWRDYAARGHSIVRHDVQQAG